MNLFEKYDLISEDFFDDIGYFDDLDSFVNLLGGRAPTGTWGGPDGNTFILDPPEEEPKEFRIWDSMKEYLAANPRVGPPVGPPVDPPVLTPTMLGIKDTIKIFQSLQDGGQGDYEDIINKLWMDYVNEVLKEAGIIVE